MTMPGEVGSGTTAVVAPHRATHEAVEPARMTPFTDGQDVQLDIFGNQMPTEALGTPCTSTEECRAEANDHKPDCPKERELLDALGY